MTVYKVNKKQMFGMVVLILYLSAIFIGGTVLMSTGMDRWGGFLIGAWYQFIGFQILGFTRINREKKPIEEIDIDPKRGGDK